MAKDNNKSEPWLGITFLMMLLLGGVVFAILFPKEAFAVIEAYLLYIVAAVVLIIVLYFGRSAVNRIRNHQQDKVDSKRKKQIKLIEQLIWRSRYSLQSKKAVILADDTPETREQWKQEKIRYARERIFPVIPESEVPMNLVSSLIEKSLSGSGLHSSRLPTYNVRDEY